MISRKPNLLKFGLLLSLSVILLFLTTQVIFRGIKLPETYTPIVNYAAVHPIKSNSALRDSIVNFGMQFLGTPYVSGGCSKDGFDCSGYVYYVYQHFKIQVPRSSIEFNNFGIEIPIEEVRKGDILLFLSPTRNVIGHVGIVTNANGNESEFIHSSSGRTMKVVVSSLKTKGYSDRFVKAVNVLESYDAKN